MSSIDVVREILAKRVDVSKLDENNALQDLGLDSLDLVEITLEIEDKFHIEFTSNEIANLKTVKDVVELITRKTK